MTHSEWFSHINRSHMSQSVNQTYINHFFLTYMYFSCQHCIIMTFSTDISQNKYHMECIAPHRHLVCVHILRKSLTTATFKHYTILVNSHSSILVNSHSSILFHFWTPCIISPMQFPHCMISSHDVSSCIHIRCVHAYSW